MGIDAGVVFNKSDLGVSAYRHELDTYFDIGYDVVACSAVSGERMDDVRNLLASHCSIIVGQSGVGKSSIINRLLGKEAQRTSEISDKSREGRHTTVNSTMITLPGGGMIIDSPGVRDYAPALESSTIASQGFREISDAGQECRFANCRHLREPGCAVKERTEDGLISPRRYESYKRIVNLTEQLAEGRY
jgi:ribosome biogenesis GTPase